MTPLIDCLMVTRPSRIPLLDLSIRSLGLQVYQQRKLVVVSDDWTSELRQAVAKSCQDHNVVYKIVEQPPGQSLGALRNASMAGADSNVLCQWDDDDQYHSQRLLKQFRALGSNSASFLTSQLYWLAPQRELHVIDWQRMLRPRSCIPGTILHRNSSGLCYPDAKRGEDSVFREQFSPDQVAEVSNQPWLYLRTFHGLNTWTEDRFRANVHRWAPKVRVLIEMIPRLREECRAYAFGRGPIKIMHRDAVVIQFVN